MQVEGPYRQREHVEEIEENWLGDVEDLSMFEGLE